MLKYPREISLSNNRVRIQRMPERSPSIKEERSRRLVDIPNIIGGSSFNDLPRTIPGVDIRQCEGADSLKLAPFGGHLRQAYSHVEGLDVLASKYSGESSSREFDRSKDTLLTTGKNSSGQISEKSSGRHTSGRTTFEQVREKFQRKHRSEIKAGKCVGFYRFILDIGRGNFSKVKLANHSLLNVSVAVKVIDRSKFNVKTRRLLAQELCNMERLNHPHIIKIFEAHTIKDRCCLMMEYAPAGELHSYLMRHGRMEDGCAKHISAQIVSAVRYMHDHNVIHRDLKAENILFFSANFIKVGDFGFSKYATAEDNLTTFCGSPSYAAPELFVGRSYPGFAVDMWALGVLIFYMVAGFLPFPGDCIAQIKQAVLNETYKIPPYVKPECKELISGLLRASISRRLKIDHVQRSAWYADQNWSNHSSALPPNSNQLDSSTARQLLQNWWNVESWELNEALATGPTNSMTGLYRILLAYGKRFEGKECPFEFQSKKDKRKKSPPIIENGNVNGIKKNKKLTEKTKEEVTTADLRDPTIQKKSVTLTRRESRTCTIS